MTGILNLLAGAVSSVVKDTYFNLVSLLLPGNGTNGAQNNTFLDSSTNNFTITRNGNTTQGTFSPFSQTGWSNFFDGSSRLTIGSSTPEAVLQLGSSDFTIEMWVYTTSSSAAWQYAISNLNNGVGNLSWSVRFYGSTGVISFLWGTSTSYLGNVEYTSSNNAISPNTWTHVAITRSGSTFRIFANGTQVGTGTSSTAVYSQTQQFYIGATNDNADRFNGYVSNLRVVKGGALYTSSFTPSTTPLTTSVSSGSVSALTCQSNRFIDNSSNALAITVATGTPSVQAFSPFAPTAAYDATTVGGSGYFDGSGDYLSVADNAAFDFGSGDFTIELWAYMTGAAQQFFVSQWNSPQRAWVFLVKNSGATLSFTYSTTGSNEINIDGSITAPVNAWAHFAAVRNGNTVKTYMNGIEIGSGSVTGVTLFNASQAIEVGRNSESTSTWNFTGYMAGLRILKGTAQYTAAFTPPTSPPTAITNTSFLLNYTNAGITDATAKNDLETVGNAQISTTQSKFGGSSMYFDGTGDYLQVTPNPLFDLRTSDFTVEFWIYPTSFASATYPLYSQFNRSTTNAFAIEISTGGIVYVYVTNSGGSAWSMISSGNIGTVTLNTWNHVAFVRNGSAFRGYVNGVQGSLSTNSSNTIETFNGFNIGATGAGTSGYFTGYLDDFRISRYARYTAAFTPPAAAFSLQ